MKLINPCSICDRATVWHFFYHCYLCMYCEATFMGTTTLLGYVRSVRNRKIVGMNRA